MSILITPRELLGQRKWGHACILLDRDAWAVNEGNVDLDEEITLTADQAADLGLTQCPAQETKETDQR